MTSLLIASKLIAGGRGLAGALLRRAPTVALDWDTRQKSRFEAIDTGGRRIGVFLPRGVTVRGGDVLVGDDGSLVRVQALAQPILVAAASAASRDPRLDLPARMLETATGDVTIHCSDTLHRAHPPVERPRMVVYSGFRLPPLPGDESRPADPAAARAQRAGLSDVQSRIEASDNDAAPDRYRAGRGH